MPGACEQVEMVEINKIGPLPSLLHCESLVSEKENPDWQKVKLLLNVCNLALFTFKAVVL